MKTNNPQIALFIQPSGVLKEIPYSPPTFCQEDLGKSNINSNGCQAELVAVPTQFAGLLLLVHFAYVVLVIVNYITCL